MNIKSFFKKLFGIAIKEVEVVVDTKVEPAVEAYVKQKIQEIDVEKATKAIETISIDLDILQMKWVSIYRQDSP